MVKMYKNSKIEIWCQDYINEILKRAKEDQNVNIIQIEYGSGNNYIVEVIGKEDDEYVTNLAYIRSSSGS